MTSPRQRWIPGSLVAAGVLLLLAGVWYGQPTTLLDQASDFGRVRVVERRDGVRELYLGDSPNRQTAMHPDRPGELILPYTRIMLAGVALAPEAPRTAVIGLGGGALPRWLIHRVPGATVDAAELNPLVVDAARRWFALPDTAPLSVHVGDGRAYLESSPPGQWDVILLDAFSAEGIPRTLSTLEFVQAVARALRPGGVAVTNLHTVPPRYHDMVATWLHVFPGAVEIQVPGRRQRILVARAGTGDDGRGVPQGGGDRVPDSTLPVPPLHGPTAAAAYAPGARLTREALLHAVARFEGLVGPVPGLASAVAEGFRVPQAGSGGILRDVPDSEAPVAGVPEGRPKTRSGMLVAADRR